jgi:hypothetical protein
MGQSVDFWNRFIQTLKDEGLFKEHLGDRFNIENTPTCGISLVLRLVNNKPHLNDFDDLDDLSTHPVITFARDVEHMIKLAEDMHGTEIRAKGIFIANRQFEVSFC